MLRSHGGESMVNAYLSKPGEASVRAATLATALSGPYTVFILIFLIVLELTRGSSEESLALPDTNISFRLKI